VHASFHRPTGLGHVPEHHHHPGDGPVLAADRGAGVVDRDLLPVPGDQGGVVGQPDDHALPQYPGDRVLDRLAGRLVDDAENPVE
jgi:hypothetical protein